MKMLLTAIAMTIALPAAVQADQGHAGHAAPAAKADGKTKDAAHSGACHMMNGKMMAVKDGKMVPCPASQPKPKGKPAADPHAGHDMSKK